MKKVRDDLVKLESRSQRVDMFSFYYDQMRQNSFFLRRDIYTILNYFLCSIKYIIKNILHKISIFP